MIRSTNRTGKALLKELYTEALRSLRKRGHIDHHYLLPKDAWPIIRAYGKQILKNDQADDSECADAVIMEWRDWDWH